MPTARSVLFWLHLAAGVTAGAVILIMSLTGLALTYEKQVTAWADRQGWPGPPSVDARPLAPETLLVRVRDQRPAAAPASLTMRANRRAPATVAFEGGESVLVDPYTGAVLCAPSPRVRAFFRTMTAWHRYLALGGASRATGRMVTGAANLLFLFIVISGMYLWIPRIRSLSQFAQVLWFRRGLQAKARDFNWHNVVGIWSAVPLAIVVAGAVPISYTWANALVYRVAGDAPPQAGGPGRAPESQPPIETAGLDGAWRAAVSQVLDWQSISVRLPRGAAPFVLSVDAGTGGEPQRRGTLMVTRQGAIDRWETFDEQSRGRRLRTWLRFAHTGEFYGIAGQTVAGLASAGGAVLVYTGLALALRRAWAWTGRRRRVADVSRKAA